MASSHDVYSTQPAFPFLASSLLAPYDMRNAARSSGGGGDHQTATTADDRSSWDLKPAFDKFSGVSRYRNESRFLFRCGSTIGVSYLKEWWNTSNPDMSRDLLGQIPKRLLARYLLGLQNEQTTQKGPRVYIIRPSHSSTFAPDALLEAILEEEQASRRSPPPQTVLSRDQAIDLLDCVELLTIHDFAATTRAISQVSDRLYAMQQQQQQQLRQPKTNNQDDPALGQEEEGEEKEEDDDNNNKRNLPSTVLFIIEGLDAMAENVIRNSDALRGSAVLTPALRTLTYLSRSYASFLSIVLVNTTGLGSHPPSRSSQPPPGLSVSQSHGGGGGGDGMSNNNRNNNMKSAGGLYSVFSRTHRQDNNDDDNDNDTDEPLPLLHTLLSRTMDQAIDIHLLFQLRKNQSLVEVVKDRTGDGLGKWCVWS